jgi:transcriptional regulator with XRE-family HTH domain
MITLSTLRSLLGTPEKFIDEVESFLVANDVKQVELASRAGMGRAQLNRYLKRTQVPSLEVMLRLNEAMVALDYERP